MKAKLERQLGILQEKALRALSHTSTSLCPLGQNTLSFQLPESTTLNCRAFASAWNAPSSSTQSLLPYSSHFRLTILSAGKDACQCKVSPSLCYSSSTGHLSCVILIKM